jgi:hypothetical protein
VHFPHEVCPVDTVDPLSVTIVPSQISASNSTHLFAACYITIFIHPYAGHSIIPAYLSFEQFYLNPTISSSRHAMNLPPSQPVLSGPSEPAYTGGSQKKVLVVLASTGHQIVGVSSTLSFACQIGQWTLGQL